LLVGDLSTNKISFGFGYQEDEILKLEEERSMTCCILEV